LASRRQWLIQAKVRSTIQRLGKNGKAMEIAAFDDLQPPWTGFGDRFRHYRPLVAAIGVDALDEREGTAGLPQYGSGTVAVLNIGGMNDDAQQEAQGVHGVGGATGAILTGVLAVAAVGGEG
jgi:hypothetical protein